MWHRPERNLRHNKFTVESILNSLKEYGNRIGYLFYGQLPVIQNHVGKTLKVFLDGVNCKTSRICFFFPVLNSATHACNIDISGALSPNRATMPGRLSLRATALFSAGT